jgi:hypothetical protein
LTIIYPTSSSSITHGHKYHEATGTTKKPYAVTRVEDEKDVLSALKKQAGAQFMVRFR